MLDNGKNEFFKKSEKQNENKLTITDTIYGDFATITLAYPNSEQRLKGIRLLIETNKLSYIHIKDTKENNDNRLADYKLMNCMNVLKTREYKRIRKLCLNEYQKKEYYEGLYSLSKGDSVKQLYNIASEILAKKQLEFIKKNGNRYFYFWIFRKEVVPVLIKKGKQELYETLLHSFNKSFIDGDEGIALRQRIEGNLFIKKGYKLKEFETKDYLGNSYSLNNFSGKYILLSFWATWCRPCIEKLPQLRELRNKFSKDKLVIISVSRDRDTSAFEKAIHSYQMNWINVLNDRNLINLFDDTAIPAMYLIGPDKKILFSSWEDSMDSLKKILNNDFNMH